MLGSTKERAGIIQRKEICSIILRTRKEKKRRQTKRKGVGKMICHISHSTWNGELIVIEVIRGGY
jgi:hypothetical protein